MPKTTNIKQTNIIIKKLKTGSDLLAELNAISKTNNITLGRVEAIGAVQKANVGFYNQVTKKYQEIELNERLEITNLSGNISLKDNEPIVHAHITFSDEKGHAFGGHLNKGTVVFACEVVIHVFEGITLERGYDEVTGLPLWQNAELDL